MASSLVKRRGLLRRRAQALARRLAREGPSCDPALSSAAKPSKHAGEGSAPRPSTRKPSKRLKGASGGGNSTVSDRGGAGERWVKAKRVQQESVFSPMIRLGGI